MTPSQDTIDQVRADLDAADAKARERRRSGGARIVTKADRERARERHILKTADVIERAEEHVDKHVEGACILCGERRNLSTDRRPGAIDGLPKVLTKVTFVNLDRISGGICSPCEKAWDQTDDLADFVTRRLWEEQGDLLKKEGFVKRGEDPSGAYSYVTNPRQFIWGLHVIAARRNGRRDPKRPKSPFAWMHNITPKPDERTETDDPQEQ